MSLSIAINKPPGEAYMPGEMIGGTVTVDILQPVNCEGLTLTFSGRADVRIIEIRHERREKTFSTSEHRSYENITHEEVYIAEEIYLSGTLTLLGPCILQTGRVVFPFQYSLPTEALPCTFVASHGRIHYEILAQLHTPLFNYDIREGISFIIGPLLDLNKINLHNFPPAHYVDEKQVGGCCGCGGNDKIKLQIIVPKRHFVPGEFIRFTVILDNHAGTDLLSGRMSLVMTILCAAQGRVRQDETVHAQLMGPAVPKNASQTWIVDDMWIPVLTPVGLPPTGLGGCSIIDVQYGLRFYAQLNEGCCSGSIDAFIPLIIGTIPTNF